MSHRFLRRALPYLAAALIAALPLFAHLDVLPVRLWDESRLAFNALEMARGQSHWLVPTYGGEPEMWNTKPPLLIWIQALFVRSLGEGELAVRLPSALAALATCFLLVRFSDKWLQRPWLGVLAATVLVSAAGYVSLHGVRTGDYDALMTLFATGYALTWFLYTERGSRGMLWTCAACMTGAALTKGVGGWLPLPALLLYSIFSGKLIRQLRDPQLWLAMFSAGGIILAYYLGREAINPGYLDAVRANELGGRYSDVNEAHAAPARWYVENLMEYRFRPWLLWWAVGVVLGGLSKDGILRRTALFCVLFCSVHLAVISSAATKLEWYDLPVYPLAALVVAVGIYQVAGFIVSLVRHRFQHSGMRRVLTLILLGSTVLLFIQPYRAALRFAFRHELNYQDPLAETQAAEYLQQLQRRGDGRRPDAYVWTGYYTNLAWYAAVMEGPFRSVNPASPDSLETGQRVYTFQPAVQAMLVERYAADTLEHRSPVVIYGIRARR